MCKDCESKKLGATEQSRPESRTVHHLVGESDFTMSVSKLKEEFPLHWLVWHNDYQELEKEITSNLHDKEKLDPRGRTPLMLSVTLGHIESTRVLLSQNCNVNLESKNGWTVLQEAICTGDPELVQLVMERRDYQRFTSRVGGIPDLLKRLKDAPDFYVEMKWEFTSWVPLVSRMCPSDTYKVYKSGSNVRIDTTLLGFDQSNWQRGSRSYIFKGHDESAVMMEVDHETKQVFIEQMSILSAPVDTAFMRPADDVVSSRLIAPVVTTYIDTDRISFERNKSGIWGWRSDKTEDVNGYECKVFSATNVELVTKTRTEHLTEADKSRAKSNRSPLQSFLGIAEIEEKANVPLVNGEVSTSLGNPCNITPEEYFNEQLDLDVRDIGRPKEMTTKIQKFKATLWLCDETYPLSLQEQMMPIVDLMAISSTHFAKLKDFISLQLPAGFPVKIEIPLFHILNARITFGNIFAFDVPVRGVTSFTSEERFACVIDESCFEPPSGYMRLGADNRRMAMDEDDELLQFAIQQSLLQAGSEDDQVTMWEALKNQRPSPTSVQENDEERLIQQMIAESLAATVPHSIDNPPLPCAQNIPGDNNEDEQLQIAIAMSARELEEEARRQREEEEMLQMILQLSLTEK